MKPLADQLRPASLDAIVGQTHLIGQGKPLRVAIEQRHVFSFLLWGPTGVGKTTIARVYAHAIGAEVHELSAVSASKDDIRRVVEAPRTSDVPRLLFLDEIHRFNKAQQDVLLPYVESGELVLIGATTENPSFEVIPALLSRCRVFTLHMLTAEEMHTILERTAIPMDEEAMDWIVSMANGDARQAIAVVENTRALYADVTVEHLKETVQSSFLRYDKKGEEHYDTISAFIKSMRASQPNAAVYYLARMIAAGEDPLFIARRMVIFASEDIGMAQPTALVVANEVFRAVQTVGLPEAGINLAHGVLHLALAPKQRGVYDAYMSALAEARARGNLPIPLHLRNAPTKLMKDLGYGKGYEMYSPEDYLPDALKGTTWWK